MRTLFKLAVASALLTGIGIGQAQAQMKPEDAIKYRKGLMQTIKYQFGPLADFAKGDVPYGENVIKRANILAAIAPLQAEVFPAGSDKGDTKAKPEAWTKEADFKAAIKAFADAAAKLPEAAKSADALKAAVNDVGKTCKGYHDPFRAE